MLFDSFEAYDVQETRRISKEEGSTLRLITQVCKKIQKQIPIAEIAEMLEDISVIQPIYNIAVRHAPDYNVDAIFAELHPESSESK